MEKRPEMKLKQTRECDGSCCVQSPRWPRKSGKPGCEFSKNGKCDIIDNGVTAPKVCPALPEMTGAEAVEYSCNGWPHNMPEGRDPGNCCWEWVDG